MKKKGTVPFFTQKTKKGQKRGLSPFFLTYVNFAQFPIFMLKFI